MRRGAVLVLAAVLSMGALAMGQPKYVVLCDIAWAPFEWVSAKGAYLGFDLDVMRAIAILEGYEIEIRDTPFDSIIPAVIAGKGDIGASGFTINEERAQVVDFSEPYWTSDQAIVTRAGAGLDVAGALAAGRKVGAQRGTTGAGWVEEHYPDVTLVLYETYPEAVLDLLAGRLDAVVQDVDPSKQAVAQYPGLLEIAGIIETGEQFGFLVAKGDPKGILPLLSSGMAKLKDSGAWDLLVSAYFGPGLEEIEAAWEASIDILLVEKDVLKFAQTFAALVAE
ncbi:MAG TPA: transporter substrate-binding domain-containing protein [Candidatus Bipolaricaulis sp.]|nr:transporter substrate-binding domain-containing protein [Candidatus Bipolaricaulis sp.]MDY0391908.1 transporter substrate-binding domain-containing protein [Candidatus Bipolaricaulis sp.]HPD06301.1 transporter substrate-binding domain-containing protein [Candidatus Bipolaricaulis sp.]HRS14229.1 transporter substrate-binding domain-containing protein [Candidatus Bipolaricaulis sp.]HRU21698.1 transporter substrate-binding domain-containing protein [Candidatus Bipolaricaulis sp.]